MSLESIRAILCCGVLIIGGIIGFIGGVPGWVLAVVLVTGVPTLFAYGCHRAAVLAAAREKQQTLRDLAGSLVPLKSRRDNPQSE